jgi:cytochrome c553
MKTLVAAALIVLAAPAVHAADAEAGKAIAGSVCAACHNPDGISTNPIYPNLAGQHEAYLVSSIKAYKSGERKGGMSAMMAPMVANLSDDDIANVAAYYASQPAAK